jgi:hypothetical protein
MPKEGLDYWESGIHPSFRSLYVRALYAFFLVASVLLIGTVAFHYVEGYSYIEAFYFMSMLATAEGPATQPATALGKILASFMAFVGVGAVVFALAFICGPFFGRLLRIGERDIKKEGREIRMEVKKYEKKL